uniref:Uncharacterized protein n=1 Tax=Tanacetum cinerariifolium TaxID=118510 RepID=A0A699HAW6_TANCI|nr:hypothetical protein [Tanacetum cinerariifolium]
MTPKIKERISSSKKRLDLFKNTVFGKWLDFDDTNHDNHLLNYVLHHQRPCLSKNVDLDILFDIVGRTLLLGRAEFCLDKASKGKVAQPSGMIKDLGELVQKDAKWKKLSADDSIRVCLLYMLELIFRGTEDKKDDKSDAYTRQDGRGAIIGAKDSGEAMNDAYISVVVHVEETKSDRDIVLKNKVESLEAKVKKLQLDHDKMAVFFENFKKIRPELVPPTLDAKEDPSDATIDGEHMDVVGHPDKNEGHNEKEDSLDAIIDGEHMDAVGHPDENEEDPSDATIDGEHMDAVGHRDENEGPNEKEDPSDAAVDGEHIDTIGSPDETKEPNAQKPISHVLNTPVDNGDVLMTDALDTINLADPPSHESEITSPCGSKKKEDGLEGAKANQDTGFTVDDKFWQRLVAKDANRKDNMEELSLNPLKMALWPTIEENRVTKPKKYSELSATEAIQVNCDVKATNIILQGLPPEGESLHEFYLRLSLLLNDMNIYNMKLEQFQVNTKFLITLPPKWSKFMTDVRDLHTTNVDQLHAYLGQHVFHANEVRLIHELFQKGDDPIDAINNMMSFLTAVVTSRYPPTNNQLRNLSNPRQQVTINNGRVTVQPIQWRQNSLAAGTSRPYTSVPSGNN